MAPRAQYKLGDTLMAADGRKYYLAKILKIDLEGRTPKYFIHYNGWNRRWDRWVDESQLIREEDLPLLSVRKQQEAGATSKLSGAASRGRGIDAAPAPGTTAVGVGAEASSVPTSAKARSEAAADAEAAEKRRRRELVSRNLAPAAAVGEGEGEDAAHNANAAVKIQLPFQLQKHLVNEWELISTDARRHLPRLPRPRTRSVAALLSDFLTLKADKTDANTFANYRDLIVALRDYFDKCLPVILLYRQEYEQFDRLRAAVEAAHRKHSSAASATTTTTTTTTPSEGGSSGASRYHSDQDSRSGGGYRAWTNESFVPSELYGAEHFLRLYVRLPKLLSNTSVPTAEYNQILHRLGEVLKFVHKNMDKYLGGPGCYVPVLQTSSSCLPTSFSSSSSIAEGSTDVSVPAEVPADLDFDLINTYVSEGMLSAFAIPSPTTVASEDAAATSGGERKGASSREADASTPAASPPRPGQAAHSSRSGASTSKRGSGAMTSPSVDEMAPRKRGRKPKSSR